MEPPAIRPARSSDVPALARLSGQIHAIHVAAEPGVYRPFDDPAAVERWLAAYLADEATIVLLAEEGDRPLGCVLARHRFIEENLFVHAHRLLFVDQLGVAPDARRRGLGRALMRTIEARAAELEVDAVSLDVRGFNADAQAFYRSLGYGEARLTMVRRLRDA